MTTSTLLELFGGFMAACFALWFVGHAVPAVIRHPYLHSSCLWCPSIPPPFGPCRARQR
jgi:hypothetical protein